MKNSLVATPIVNKNGVRTTVYKRGEKVTVNKASLPAPTSIAPHTTELTSAERAVILNDITTRYSKKRYPLIGLTLDHKNPLVMPFRETLEKYSNDLIAKLHANVQSTEGGKGAFFLIDKASSEERLTNYLALFESGQNHERIFETGRGYSFNLLDALNSLSTYPQLQYENTENYYQQITALTGVVTAIQSEIPTERHWDDHSNGRLISYTPNPEYGRQQLARLTSDDLIDLILEQPERWEQIADIVVARSSDDVRLVRSILNSDASAIAEGKL
jgi:hypothetical protein